MASMGATVMMASNAENNNLTRSAASSHSIRGERSDRSERQRRGDDLDESRGDTGEQSTETKLKPINTEFGSSPASKKEPVEWVVGRYHELPRRVVVRSLEILDSRDSPDRPGMINETTLRAMVYRFDKVFANQRLESKVKMREEKVENVIKHLQRHTIRRRGQAVLQEGFVEWEQTSRIYELFSVDLNVFERIYLTVDVGESSSVLSKICSFFLIGMIFVSIVTWMISTLPSMQEVRPDCEDDLEVGECAPEPFTVFKVIEAVSVITFTVEYCIKLFTVHSVRFQLLDEFFLEEVLVGERRERAGSRGNKLRSPPDKLEGKLMRTIRKMTSPENLIDLLAILPFWLEVIQGDGGSGGFLVVLRILRLTRVFRVFKLGKYNEVFTLFARVVEQSMSALLLMIFFICLGCCLFGTLVWFAEQGTWYPRGHKKLIEVGVADRGAYLRHSGAKEADDLEESPFYSIVHSFWFVIVTITTVGYGDLSPTTPAGKVIGGLTILNGVIVLAMPIGVVGANFSSEYYKVLDEKKRRLRLKQQLDTLAAVEEEQDAALCEDGGGTPNSSKEDNSVATELLRIDDAQKRLLIDAEAIDHKWEKFLPPALYKDLTDELRQIVSGLLCADNPASASATSGGLAKPVIPMTKLLDLDQLTVNVNSAIISATSLEDLAEFGLDQALEQRQCWSTFVKDCWEYAVKMCRVEKKAEPMEYFQMKANLARGGMNANRRTMANCANIVRTDLAIASSGRSRRQSEEADAHLSPATGLQHRGDPEDVQLRLDPTPLPPSNPQEKQRCCSESEKDDPEITGPPVKESSETTALPGMMADAQTVSVELT